MDLDESDNDSQSAHVGLYPLGSWDPGFANIALVLLLVLLFFYNLADSSVGL
jgi:hypothetical protein